ncbi:hypothetical protein LTR09_004569 [Extremus antarcticus]|uniref:PEBP-like protein n=1 Tax=Extremus antarcticus TaxID=702011 RepID=A0AAJ0DHN7_9PEZI|nr:hypothetical protein LTR09_004569 [Extremus antarcticus]
MHFSTIVSALLTASVSFASPTPTEKRATSCSPVGISAQSSARVVSAFKSSKIVAELIPSISPKVAVSAAYGSKQVDLGNKFKTTETLLAPTVSFSGEKDKDAATTKYSYFLIDPDVPSPDGVAGMKVTFLHLAVSNAQPSCIKNQSPSTDAIYQPLTPASTTQHRYTFLVYRQPSGYTPDTVAFQVRAAFDINAYAARKGLVLVGGNFLREAITNL